MRQDFAVMLLRTGYETADKLDFIAMDKFQQNFWLRRRSEWEAYRLQYAPIIVEQGKITDPLYFDFISGMQFVTIAKGMKDGKQIFKEYCDDCEEQYVLVTRDPSLQDNEKLPQVFQQEMGEAILTKLGEFDKSVESMIDSKIINKKTSFPELLNVVTSVLDSMTSMGFAVQATVSEIGDGAKPASFRVTLSGPSNLWAVQYLNSKNQNLLPVYDTFVTKALFKRANKEAVCRVRWTRNSIIEDWTVE